MTTVGKLLRDARNGQERAIAEIAEELCLTQRYLQALEEDDLKYFAGAFFYKSFVRQYAAALGVNTKHLEPLLAPITDASIAEVAAATDIRYASRTRAVPIDRASVRRLDPLVEETNQPYFSRLRMRWSVAALAVMVMACSGFYAWWTRAPETAAPPPASSEIQTSRSTPLAAPTAMVESDPVQLTFLATERTWLSISTNGRQIFSGFLQPSEKKTLSGVDSATLRIGNAAGIEIKWNGKPLGPIGARGEVRTVLLTQQSFEIL